MSIGLRSSETTRRRALDKAPRDRPYSMAWIDCLAWGATLGRSLVTRGEFMARDALPARLSHEPRRRRAG